MVRMTPEQQIQEELDAMARARMNKRIAELENALADARRDHADLVGLVQRMGRDLLEMGSRYDRFLVPRDCGPDSGPPWEPIDGGWTYTLIGQREYDAAMHEAEGPPETRESTGAWGHGGPGL